MTAVYGTVQQSSVSVTGEGHGRQLRLSRRGGLYTASQFEDYVAGGQGYRVQLGGLTAGADALGVTGGGAGTTIDSDQPEMLISIPSGTSIIPVRGRISMVTGDADTNAEILNAILLVDMAKAWDSTGTSTAGTIRSSLGGGLTPTSNCTFAHTFTADTTDPVATFVLAHMQTIIADQGTAASALDMRLNLEYFGGDDPIVIHGPAMVVACWGGTAAASAIASFSWVEAPTTNFS